MNYSEPKTQIDRLRQRIVKAFSSVPRPSKENIARHECEKCEELRNVFAPLSWDSIDRETLETYHGKLPLFTPQAFHYFLPAYLLQSLQGFNDDNIVCEFTIIFLCPTVENEAVEEWWLERMKQFTPEQKDVIAIFLKLAIINRKLRSYRDLAEFGLNQNLRHSYTA